MGSAPPSLPLNAAQTVFTWKSRGGGTTADRFRPEGGGFLFWRKWHCTPDSLGYSCANFRTVCNCILFFMHWNVFSAVPAISHVRLVEIWFFLRQTINFIPAHILKHFYAGCAYILASVRWFLCWSFFYIYIPRYSWLYTNYNCISVENGYRLCRIKVRV